MSDNDYSKDDEISECSSCGKEQELGTFNIIDYVDGIQKTYCDKCYKNHKNDEGKHYPFYEEQVLNEELSTRQSYRNSFLNMLKYMYVNDKNNYYDDFNYYTSQAKKYLIRMNNNYSDERSRIINKNTYEEYVNKAYNIITLPQPLFIDEEFNTIDENRERLQMVRDWIEYKEDPKIVYKYQWCQHGISVKPNDIKNHVATFLIYDYQKNLVPVEKKWKVFKISN
jgi:hypothetical protein